MDSYWLSLWLDEQDLSSASQVAKAVGSRQGFESAVELAASAPQSRAERLAPVPEGTVVAGRGVDLSLSLSCSHFDCRVGQIDQLFATTGHYFDHVVVEGLSSGAFLREAQTGTPQGDALARETLEVYARLLVYLRQIGADRYLIFRDKPHAFCADHYRQHAQELGLPAALDSDLADSIIDLIEREGQVTPFELEDGRRGFWFRNPLEDVGYMIYVLGEQPSASPDLRSLARSVVDKHALAAVSDYALAKMLESPLATTADRVLDPATRAVAAKDQSIRNEANVMLALRLPVLSGLSAKELIQMRETNQAEFAKFRRALTTAAREQIAAADSEDPDRVAQRVTRDYIEPALADIETGLRASRRALAKKAMQSVSVGAALVGVGLLGNLPLVLSAGIAATSGTLLHANRFIEEKRELETQDLFFLWKVARRHADSDQ